MRRTLQSYRSGLMRSCSKATCWVPSTSVNNPKLTRTYFVIAHSMENEPQPKEGFVECATLGLEHPATHKLAYLDWNANSAVADPAQPVLLTVHGLTRNSRCPNCLSLCIALSNPALPLLQGL